MLWLPNKTIKVGCIIIWPFGIAKLNDNNNNKAYFEQEVILNQI